MKIVWDQEDWERLDAFWPQLYSQLTQLGYRTVHVYHTAPSTLHSSYLIETFRLESEWSIFLFDVRRVRPQNEEAKLRITIISPFIAHMEKPIEDFLNMLFTKELSRETTS